MATEPDRSSSSRRRGGAAVAPGERRCSTRRGQLGVDIDSVCGGRGDLRPLPGRAERRQLPEARIESKAGNLSPLGPVEADYRRGRAWTPAGGCRVQPHVRGDVVVDVPPESQVYRQVVRKGLSSASVNVDPVVRLHYVEVRSRRWTRRPATSRASGMRSGASGASDLRGRPRGHPRPQPALEQGNYTVTVAVHEGRGIIAVWPGFHDRAYGVAIDVGSTTIAGHLANLADGAVLASPRRDEPADPLRRGPHEPGQLRDDASRGRRRDDAGRPSRAQRARSRRSGSRPASRATKSSRVTIVGNPIMHHLLLGIDPVPLGSAPFALATDRRARASGGRSDLRPIPARASTSCPASPATSAPTRPA